MSKRSARNARATPSAAPRPIVPPASAGSSPRRMTSLKTRLREAPSATRMPISFVRRAHQVGKRSVDPDGRQEKTQQREERNHAAGESRLCGRAHDERLQRQHFVERASWRRRLHEIARRGQRRRRVAGRLDEHEDPRRRAVLHPGHEHVQRGRLADGGELDVADHSDDFTPLDVVDCQVARLHGRWPTHPARASGPSDGTRWRSRAAAARLESIICASVNQSSFPNGRPSTSRIPINSK